MENKVSKICDGLYILTKCKKTGKYYTIANPQPQFPGFVLVQDNEKIIAIDLILMKEEDLEIIDE